MSERSIIDDSHRINSVNPQRNASHIGENIEEEYTDNPDDPELIQANIQTVSISSGANRSNNNYQPRIDCSLSTQSSFEDGGSKLEVTNKLLFMITKDNLPYRTVEKEGFKVFIKSILPLYKIPCRKTIANLIQEKYEVLCNIIRDQLRKVVDISLTTDIWTDQLNTKSYLGLTAHYIFDNKHKSVTIGVTQLYERHSAENIKKWLRIIIKEWGVNTESILVIVSDSGSNIKKAIKDEFGPEKHLPCFAHALNLITSKVIESNNIHVIVKKVKSIVCHFKKSIIAADELRKVTELKLIQSVETRWNSTYEMLSRFIELSDKIGCILLQYPTAPAMINATELHIVKEFVVLLKPFQEATRIISGENYLTASKVIPIVNTLKVALIEAVPETETGKQMKELLLEEFNSRFYDIEDTMILALSTILDPRFKTVHFNSNSACSNSVNKISSALSRTHLDAPAENSVTRINATGFWSYHETLVSRIRSEEPLNVQENEISDMLRYYLIQPPVKMDTDPINFWQKNDTPLAKLGKKYLAAIATSVPCERLFSKAGQIMTEARNRLSGDHLQQLLFLGSLSKEEWNF
ncbi:E3 SUMO-protein ligase ZBED1-like [Prorops nasuta]|uniref:E3 SUMO-protein ligase ZBED1-like n=1 Tax=Prorops nasuta TaxID=863751 RepID=UPI0034CF44CF